LWRAISGGPTKVEGNPDHPGSLGSTNTFAQAAVLGLWDPDRAQSVTHYGELSTWPSALAALIAAREAALRKNGGGLRILTERVVSPTLEDQMKALTAKLPGAKWHQYEPVSSTSAQAGAQLAFGRPVNPVYSFDKADVIVSLDSDFLQWGTASVRYARDFAARRRVLINTQKDAQPKENRQRGLSARSRRAVPQSGLDALRAGSIVPSSIPSRCSATGVSPESGHATAPVCRGARAVA
jgi:hypothetical protein